MRCILIASRGLSSLTEQARFRVKPSHKVMASGSWVIVIQNACHPVDEGKAPSRAKGAVINISLLH